MVGRNLREHRLVGVNYYGAEKARLLPEVLICLRDNNRTWIDMKRGFYMELGTFGAIMTFAMELEKHGVTLYGEEGSEIPEGLQKELLRGSRKRLKRLERAKREGVAEMILESISGLSDEAYQVEEAPSRLGIAIIFEETSARFFRDAAEKLPIREISRLFTRLAAENEVRVRKLKEHQS